MVGMTAMCQNANKNTKADIVATYKEIGTSLKAKRKILAIITALSPFVMNVNGKGKFFQYM
jgi:hypothetical protein